MMASGETKATAPPVSRMRIRFPVVLLTVTAIGLIVLWFLPETTADEGLKRFLTTIVVAVVTLMIFLWFVLFSRAAGTTRLIVLLAGVGLLGATAASVRRIEFTGMMQPIFDWRWTPDRNQVLETHRAALATKTAEAPLEPFSISERDITDYRGHDTSGIIEGPPLAREWTDKQMPKLVWRQPVGGGYAAFVVVGPLAITIEQRRDQEAVVAYDTETAVEHWVHEYPALFSEKLGGDGPRATPTVVANRVYALGATGILSCLDLLTGRLIWSKNILQENHSGNLAWGMSGSPLVYDDLVIVNPGTQAGSNQSKAILAFTTDTGKLKWGSGTGQAGYASPMLAEIDGTRQILMFEGQALVGYDAGTGAELWRSEWKSDFDINAVQPIVLPDNQIFITSNTGGQLLQFKAQEENTSVERVWKNRNLKGQYDCPIAYDGYIYGLDNGILVCLDIKDGRRCWKGGRFGNGQMLLTGGLLLVLGEQGELALVEAQPEAFRETGRIQAIEGRTWNNPTLRNGRIFVRNHLEMAAYDLPLASPDSP